MVQINVIITKIREMETEIKKDHIKQTPPTWAVLLLPQQQGQWVWGPMKTPTDPPLHI